MPDYEEPTGEVASEGGSEGNVEIESDDEGALGSESTSTVDRVKRSERTIARDETETTGRRSPVGPEQG